MAQKSAIRTNPTEEEMEISLECARVLASVTHKVGGSSCVIEVNSLFVDEVDAGAWKITVQRVADRCVQ